MLFSMFILTRYGLAIHKPHLRLKKNSEIESHFYLSSLSSFETGGKVAGHNFWKNEIAQGHNINPLESNGSKMADKSTLTRPWPSINKENDTTKSHDSSSSAQSLSRVWLFATPWTTARQASLSITNSWSTQTHVHWVSDAIQPSYPLSSPSPPALNLSQHQGLFKWVSSSHHVAKV